jgi:Dienelactone hydrolase family
VSFTLGTSVKHHVSGQQHVFNNDTAPRYDNAGATVAWQRTIHFFKKEPARLTVTWTAGIGARESLRCP